MKRVVFLFVFVLCLSVSFVLGQQKRVSSDNVWTEIDDSILQQKQLSRPIIPKSYRTYTLDKIELQKMLEKAPMEFSSEARDNSLVMTLPMPDGKYARFLVTESPIMEPALAAKHPDFKTYSGKGIDDPTATARFDITPEGFHSMILSTGGTILVDPYSRKNTDNYISYYKNDAASSAGEFVCNVKDAGELDEAFSYTKFIPELNVSSGTVMRTYRLALATTGEYTNVFRQAGDTDAQARVRALAAMTAIMNRVNGVYERDLAIRMIMVANEDSIIYTDPTTDPYTNSNGSTMLGQNQTNLDSVIGSANYDIGHVFSTGGGGIAGLRVPCGSGKARGVTGLSNPVGDPFAIDYVAHEMGHQWGGNHTFNSTVSNCGGGNRSGSAAYEPGSGITIMAYAGICGNQDLAAHSIDTFHVRSLEEIVAYSQTGNGNTCAVTAGTGNAPPIVSAPTSFNIPKGTPFALTASASDLNGDMLTYDWQEYDLGGSTTAVPNTDSDGVARPIFRAYSPTTSPTRYFPSLQFILNNANVPPSTSGGYMTGELMPSITRTMNFQVIVRDNRAGGGGINTATTAVNVDGNSGPFTVSAPNTNVIWNASSSQTVMWDVNNTNNAPVSAANVKISLSTDGGQTFPFVLSASTPNDGTETVTVPNISTTQARIKVEAVNNIFFDISDADFSINSGQAASVSVNGRVLDFNGRGIAGARIMMTGGGANAVMAMTNPFGYYQFPNVTSGASYTFVVSSKRHQFVNPTTLVISNNLSDFNFTALP